MARMRVSRQGKLGKVEIEEVNLGRTKKAFFMATYDDQGFISVRKSKKFRFKGNDEDPLLQIVKNRFRCMASDTEDDDDEGLPSSKASKSSETSFETSPLESSTESTVSTPEQSNGLQKFSAIGKQPVFHAPIIESSHQQREADVAEFNGGPYNIDTEPMDIDTKPLARTTMMKTFRIDETAKVRAFYISKLDSIQQMGLKRIAKAWIRAICPRKQAKFPYHNKAREEKDKLAPLVPGWWPDLDAVCPFTEPDHVNKQQRRELVVHLLTLRPTPMQLKAWNNEAEPKNVHDDEHDPNNTHMTRGWTAFLKEAASSTILDGLPHETDAKAKRRRLDLNVLYEVADMEEHYQLYGVGGDIQFQYVPDEKKPKPRLRRHRKDTQQTDEEVLSSPSRCLQAKKRRASEAGLELSKKVKTTVDLSPIGGSMSNLEATSFIHENGYPQLPKIENGMPALEHSEAVTFSCLSESNGSELSTPLMMRPHETWDARPPGPHQHGSDEMRSFGYYPTASYDASSFSSFQSYYEDQDTPIHAHPAFMHSRYFAPTDAAFQQNVEFVNHGLPMDVPYPYTTPNSPYGSFTTLPPKSQDMAMMSMTPYRFMNHNTYVEHLPENVHL